jgi:hypothetical protein
MQGSVAVRALDRILTSLCAASEAQTALETSGLHDSYRDPNGPGTVGGIGASQKTIAVESEIIVRVNCPALQLDVTA